MKETEYILDDAVWQNKKDARHFLVPTKEEVKSLDIGDQVRMTFIPKDDTFGCPADKMWVEITSIGENDTYEGVLMNQPRYLHNTDYGAVVVFKRENISEIFFQGEEKIDDHKFALITKKALENKEVNCVARTVEDEESVNSGWQLFYGDESEDYLSDLDNIEIVTLEDVMNFEPLLEKIFNKHDGYYEYSHKNQEFVKF